MRYVQDICLGTETFRGCGHIRLIANRTKKLCINCNQKRLSNAKSKVQRLPKGELQLFIEIWNERPHYSEVSGTPILYFDVRFFSHILSKGSEPRARLDKENILIKTFEEHKMWEFQAHKLRNQLQWKKVFELKEKLKIKYNAGQRKIT